MATSLTLPGHGWRRFWSFLAGSGMIAAAFLTIRHFYLANFPETIYKGAFCDLSAFFNCDSSAFSKLAHYRGVPMGFLGLMAGALVVIGAVFPSLRLERTNKFLAFCNGLGVLFLLGYSLFVAKSLCLLCSGYYLFSLLNLFLFWRYGFRGERRGAVGFVGSFGSPSLKILVVAAAIFASGAYGFHEFTAAKEEAQKGGVAAKAVEEFDGLAVVGEPSFISPYRLAQATDRWEDAPIRVVEFGDYLCPDCLFMDQLLTRLKQDFAGKINIAFQFFPLDKCNDVVVEKAGLHAGACDLAYIAARDPGLFPVLHQEIFAHFQDAHDPAWREDLARRYGLEAALTDPATKDIVLRIMRTGAEYEKTSEKFSHGIRSTPTLIVNGRMIIGTLPYPQMKAIFESLLTGQGGKGPGAGKFMENWVDTRPARKAKPAKK